MFLKRKAISSILLELDSDDLPLSEEGNLKDSLSREVIDLTVVHDYVARLLEYERRLIKERKSNGESSFIDDDITTSTVLRGLYKSTYFESDGSKHLIPNLSISEVMLMSGVLNLLVADRQKSRDSYIRELRPIKKKTEKKYKYYLRRPNGVEELDQYLGMEIDLATNIDEETAFINLMNDSGAVVDSYIYQILGIDFNSITEEEVYKITKCSIELALSYPKIREHFKQRRKKVPSLLDDVLLVECAGEDMSELAKIFKPRHSAVAVTKYLKKED